jgi:hypothetical protein
MNIRIQFEIIGASSEEGGDDGAVNLYTPLYGKEFIGTFKDDGAAISFCVGTCNDNESAIVDLNHDGLTRIRIVDAESVKG